MPIGPSTTTAPYLLADEPNVTITSIATVGDVLGTKSDGITPYRFVGIPDGMGAYDNGDGTITVLINHELRADVGVVREHGATGAFVSRLVIDKATLAVLDASDAINTVKLWDDATGSFVTTTYAIGRLCSADLADQSAYHWIDTRGTADTSDDVAYGTLERIFMTGEEIGPEGKEFGLVLTGTEAGTAYELAHTGLFSWENAISSPFAQLKTINIGMDDGLNGQVYIYIGEKQTTGNAVERAGLVGGDLFGIKVDNLIAAAGNESNSTAASGNFTLVRLGADEDGDGDADGDVSAMTGAALDAQSEALGVTSFLRPEDGQFDPNNPSVFYFVTTASFTGTSRLYKLTFSDIAQPELGGTIEVVLDSNDIPVNGTVGPRMMDNMTVTDAGMIIIQEDPGNQAHLARVLEFDPVTGILTEIATHDPALFTAGLPGFITQDEESSGVIDVTALFGGTGQTYLSTDQIHASAGDPELVERGQLSLIHVAAVTNGTNADDRLNGDALANTLSGFNGNDVIRGGSGDDVLKGNNGDDRLEGWADDDFLHGGNGIDTLLGDAGDDRLAGGRGNDSLTGGTGADRFDFSLADSAGADTITDFVQGEDLLQLALGAFVREEQNRDFNFDGIIDTRLTLSKGGTVTLLGVADVVASDFVYSSSNGPEGAGAGHLMELMQLQQAQVIV
jgi:RTX calcium-binding nonapeptide repeat (4 copies)